MIVFYLKGAEDVIQRKVDMTFSYKIEEDCEALAREGLRTLVLAQKIITL